MNLVNFWAAALALSILLYVVLDGFDLGVGLLFPFAPSEKARRQMLAAISPVWDGNETWLVVAAATLFAAFPSVYALLLSAFYLPLLVMLAGLILRGVAFEFRYKARRLRPLWDAGFVAGSYAASFIQGTAVGAIVQGLVVKNGRYAGGLFAWLSPFALLCGLGLCVGYAMVGACWLARKGEGEIRMYALRVLPWIMTALLVFLVAVFIQTFVLNLPVLQRWTERPILFIFPSFGAVAFVAMANGVRRHDDRFLFPSAAVIFLAAFATLAVSFLPYIVPFSVTIADAASPDSSLRFLFWGGGLVVLPVTIVYTGIVYFIFRGRIRADTDYS